MNKQEAIDRLKEQQDNWDKYEAHIIADNTLCELLTALGYEGVVKEYNKVGKRYS